MWNKGTFSSPWIKSKTIISLIKDTKITKYNKWNETWLLWFYIRTCQNLTTVQTKIRIWKERKKKKQTNNVTLIHCIKKKNKPYHKFEQIIKKKKKRHPENYVKYL